MKNLFSLLILTVLCSAAFVSAQTAQQPQIQLPQASPRAEVAQTVGDARIAIVYYRPSAKGREVFGKLVPYNEVWRTGANNATVFEVTENVKINGQDLPAGKYSLHTIPTANEWTIIFNKTADQWGSFQYKQADDALRVRVKPETAPAPLETFKIDFDAVTPTTTNVVLAWERVRVPFTVDVGDVNARVYAKMQKVLSEAAPDNVQIRNAAVNFIVDNQMKAAYPDAVRYSNESLKARENFASLRARARLAAAMENYKDAVTYGDKAVAAARTAQPAINADALANFEKDLSGWKAKNR